MNFLKFLWSLLPSPAPLVPNLGAGIDRAKPLGRPEDPHISEIVADSALVVPVYTEIAPKDIRVFGLQNQNQKSDCVAETRRKLKRILFKINKGLDLDFSSVAFYRRRSNYPAGGMGAADAITIDATYGMTLDALVPSDTLTTEAAANAVKPDAYNEDIGKVFRTNSNEVTFTPGDLDTPAGTIQKTRKGIMMWFYFTAAEWSREVPVILDTTLQWGDTRALRHSVTGVEPAKYNGIEGVWIDDSALFGGLGRRFITRDFYHKRNEWASYPIQFKFEVSAGDRPHFTGSIISAQTCLRYEGFFPTNVDYIESLGPVTRQALRDFQTRYFIPTTGALDAQTVAKLKVIYP